MSAKLTTEEFIERARAVHGDRWDYSLVRYVNNKTKVEIICREHGIFSTNPNLHVSKASGCPYCGGTATLTDEAFIEKAIAVHGDRYDYSQVRYVNNRTKVTIICREHGEFLQKPNNHIASESGCPDCGGTKRLTAKQFIGRAKQVHGNRYDYSLVEYVSAHTLVTIICSDHGTFEQDPMAHVWRGAGCPECAGKRPLTTDKFIEKAVSVHGTRYDYSLVDFKRGSIKVIILCPNHGSFEQEANSHLQGHGCPDCADYGFNPNAPALLYYLAIRADNGDTRYKIGITNDLQKRYYGADLKRIRIVWTKQFATGRAAAEQESEILRQYEGDKYTGSPILLGTGNTELFTHDILGLDSGD